MGAVLLNKNENNGISLGNSTISELSNKSAIAESILRARIVLGWMTERLKVPVLKTGVLMCTVGSNPTPSCKKNIL